MVQRVNFLERGRFAFTYQNAAIATGIMLVLCIAVHVGIILHGTWMTTKVIAAKGLLKGLSMEFEKQVQLAQASKSEERTGTAILSLSTIFEHVPQWSRVLAGVAAVLPDQVWLTMVKSAGATGGAPQRKFEIEGHALSIEAINQFVQRLSEVSGFKDVVNPRSTKDVNERDFIFSIGAEVTIAQ
ncbi:MAG: PilN domain-containing protein [Deltaproteobacteria bacterium]|nr:PilN domain-containing protein [Deltaproteobacteria bacterium]